MLKWLYIKNIALVDELELSFEYGLTVLSGETGAGKSVIVNALSLVLGGRAEREYIRYGNQNAVVRATFDITRMSPNFKSAFSSDIIDNQVIIRREISRDGASKVWINDALASVTHLKEITEPLCEILGQHANQMLMKEDNHLLFLDQFAQVTDLREQTMELYTSWQQSLSRLTKTIKQRDELTQDRELLLFQREEIEKAKLRSGEEEELLREQKILDSSRALINSSSVIETILDSEENSILEHFSAVQRELDKMTQIDPELKDTLQLTGDIAVQLEELRRYMEQYGASIPEDQARLETINGRLHELYLLKKKYGGSEQAIFDRLASIISKLDDSPETHALIESLKAEESGRKAAYTEKAVTLTSVRQKAAGYLKKLTEHELAELAIDSGGFVCELTYEDDEDGIELRGRKVHPSAYGLENARFMFSANPGEPLKSLVKTASGGEISRVLLALKSAERKNNQILQSMMVFDEIDAGIGGQTAIEVAKKIKRLAEGSQLLVITHLHQIARLADYHLVAKKTSGKDGRTVIDVRQLETIEIQSELDRMIAMPVEV